MTDTFKKLNYKDQNPILILRAPPSFDAEVMAMKSSTRIDLKVENGMSYPFTLAFAENRAELEMLIDPVKAATTQDAILWFAYPKQTSKKYKSDLNRDICHDLLGARGLDANRQIAIDDDWSAMRYKKLGGGQ